MPDTRLRAFVAGLAMLAASPAPAQNATVADRWQLTLDGERYV